MARDTKLRMSIDPKIIDRLNELQEQISKVTEHKANRTELCKIRLDLNDGTGDYVIFDFFLNWSVSRFHEKDHLWDRKDENGWSITNFVDKVQIETFGKMAVDINREIEELLPKVAEQIEFIENPVYCPVCEHCGETGCCGFIGFLEKHVRGKTDCLYEDVILDELEKWIKEEDD